MTENNVAPSPVTRRADAFAELGAMPSARVPRNVWALGVTSCLTDLSAEMVVSSLPGFIVLQLGLSPFAFGAIDGLYHGFTAVARVASGIVSDRIRRYKEVAMTGYLVSALSRVVLLFITTSAAIAGVLALDRLGKGIRTAPRDTLIANSTSRSDLGLAFGIHRAFDATGAALGPFAAFTVLALAPRAYDAVFIVSLTFAVLGFFVLALFVTPTQRRTPSALAAKEYSLIRIGAILRSRRLTALLLGAVLLSLTTVSDGFLYLALRERLNLDARFIPLMFAATSVWFLAAAVPLGRVADLAGREAIFLGGYGMLLIACLAILAPISSLLQCAMVVVALGSYYAATDGVLAAMTSAAFPESMRATGLATVATAVGAARLVASVSCGYVASVSGLVPAITVFAGALAAALILTAFAMHRARREDANA